MQFGQDPSYQPEAYPCKRQCHDFHEAKNGEIITQPTIDGELEQLAWVELKDEDESQRLCDECGR